MIQTYKNDMKTEMQRARELEDRLLEQRMKIEILEKDKVNIMNKNSE